MRATESEVRHALRWALNYGEIVAFKSVASRGRRWLVEFPEGVTVEGMRPNELLSRPLPRTAVFTSREALAFAFGAAAGGARESRGAFAARTWGW